jgi:hypothetical protein
MLVLDALFDPIQQISSNVEIIGSLLQFAQFGTFRTAYSTMNSVVPKRWPEAQVGD